jgi:alkylated DNA repair dioxygenase AlkB
LSNNTYNLFQADASENVLPKDGEVNYFGAIVSYEKANTFFLKLRDEIAWENDEIIMFGKRIVTKRKVAWYGSLPFDYTYSNVKKQAIAWNETLLELKSLVEDKTGYKFNSCLLNLYHSGEEGMSWHSDDEKELLENGAIASVSFGAERTFEFKHKQDNSKVKVLLEHGSVLLMKFPTQKHWLHQLPKTKKCLTPRINLTFRTISF